MKEQPGGKKPRGSSRTRVRKVASADPLVGGGALRTFTAAWHQWQQQALLPQIEQLVRLWAKVDPALARGDELGLFASHHENEYSNWLQWAFGAPGQTGAVLRQSLLSALWPAPPQLEILVKRERRIERGHEGHAGRIDLVAEHRATRTALVVEAKTRDPGASELFKNRGYREAFAASHVGWEVRYVLLVPRTSALNNLDTHGFAPISWQALTASLRHLLVAGTLSVDPRTEALAALLCGGIEAHVLDFPLSEWRRTLLGRPGSPASLHVLGASSFIPYLENIGAKA